MCSQSENAHRFDKHRPSMRPSPHTPWQLPLQRARCVDSHSHVFVEDSLSSTTLLLAPGRQPACSSPQSLDAPHMAILFLSDRILRPFHSPIRTHFTNTPLSCHFAQQFAHPAELNGNRAESTEGCVHFFVHGKLALPGTLYIWSATLTTEKRHS